MFGPLLLYKERNLYTGIGLFLILSDNLLELIVYMSGIMAFISLIFIKNDTAFMFFVGVFAIGSLMWKFLMHALAEPDGKIRMCFYK